MEYKPYHHLMSLMWFDIHRAYHWDMFILCDMTFVHVFSLQAATYDLSMHKPCFIWGPIGYILCDSVSVWWSTQRKWVLCEWHVLWSYSNRLRLYLSSKYILKVLFSSMSIFVMPMYDQCSWILWMFISSRAINLTSDMLVWYWWVV